MNEQKKVFISYSHHDPQEKAWARKLAQELSELNCPVFFDEWELKPGENVAGAIEEGLRTSQTLVAVLSRGSETRPNLLFELGVALGAGKQLIPIVGPDVDSSKLPFAIRARQFLAKGEPAETARRLLDSIMVPREHGKARQSAPSKARAK